MHVRLQQIRGIPVIDDGGAVFVGFIDSPVINPDTGKIEGFFVNAAFGNARVLFLPVTEISGWGMQVHVQSADRLGVPEDYLRLTKLLHDPRTFIGQKIMTKDTKRSLGRLRDVQFDTRRFTVEWLFPRRFFFDRTPVPATDIIEVTPQAIIIKDPLRPIKSETEKAAINPKQLVPEVTAAA